MWDCILRAVSVMLFLCVNPSVFCRSTGNSRTALAQLARTGPIIAVSAPMGFLRASTFHTRCREVESAALQNPYKGALTHCQTLRLFDNAAPHIEEKSGEQKPKRPINSITVITFLSTHKYLLWLFIIYP